MHGDGPPCMFPWKQGSKATRYLMVDEKQSLAFPRFFKNQWAFLPGRTQLSSAPVAAHSVT